MPAECRNRRSPTMHIESSPLAAVQFDLRANRERVSHTTQIPDNDRIFGFEGRMRRQGVNRGVYGRIDEPAILCNCDQVSGPLIWVASPIHESLRRRFAFVSLLFGQPAYIGQFVSRNLKRQGDRCGASAYAEATQAFDGGACRGNAGIPGGKVFQDQRPRDRSKMLNDLSVRHCRVRSSIRSTLSSARRICVCTAGSSGVP